MVPSRSAKMIASYVPSTICWHSLSCVYAGMERSSTYPRYCAVSRSATRKLRKPFASYRSRDRSRLYQEQESVEMLCPSCEFDNPAEMNFCLECATPLKNSCPACGFDNPPQAKFCGKCAAPLTSTIKKKRRNGETEKRGKKGLASSVQGLASKPIDYTPHHLAQ